MDLYTELKKIQAPDPLWRQRCETHWDNIVKPLDSLGLLEETISQIGAITRREDVRLERKMIIAMCADNGIVEEGVTQTDNSVTAIVTENMAKGIANVNVMGRFSDTTVLPVDIGVAVDLRHPGVRNRKIAYGTKNFTKEPAMTRAQTEQAIAVGMELAAEAKADGYDLIGLGEMGIGNTTTSSALTAVFLNRSPKEVTGHGAGLSSAGLQKKIQTIQKGIALHRPDPQNPLDVLSCLGGLDIAGLVGVILGCAIHHLPVVLDGFITYAAALTAVRLAPSARSYLVASHISKEPASRLLIDELQLRPIIHGEMSLGEGTGAAALFPLLEMALAIYRQNNTFADAKIEAYQHFAEA